VTSVVKRQECVDVRAEVRSAGNSSAQSVGQSANSALNGSRKNVCMKKNLR
jgi:hypothetical protein